MAAKNYKGGVSKNATTEKPSTISTNVPLEPVRYPVYHGISELNRSFEETMQGLEHLISFNIFNRDLLRYFQVMLEEVRALANEELTNIANVRELENCTHYERLKLKYQERNGIEVDSLKENRKQKPDKKQKAARR